MKKHKPSISAFIVSFSISALLSCSLFNKPDRVQNLGIFGKNRKEHVVGQDGCTPVPIKKNIVMWTFGDTILGKWKAPLSVSSTFEQSAVMKSMICNSLAFTEMPDDINIKDLQFYFYKKRGKPVKFIDPEPDKDILKWRIWPVDGIRIMNKVYVYYMQVKIVHASGPFSFKDISIGIAEWKKPDNWKVGDAVEFKKLGTLFNKGEPSFGDSVIKKGKYLYLIGHGKPDDTHRVFAYIARVTPSNIAKRNKYEFLLRDGDWSENINNAYGYFGDVAGELSISYNRHLSRFIIIYCSLSGKIMLVQFMNFNDLKHAEPQIIFIPEKLPAVKTRPFLFYYSGKEICYTDKALYAIYINPAIYQPVLIRIPYCIIRKLSKKNNELDKITR